MILLEKYTPQIQTDNLKTYPHAFKARVRILVEGSRLEGVKKKLKLTNVERWKYRKVKGTHFWERVGGVGFHGTAPKNKNPNLLGALNKRWRTRLYGLIVNVDADGYFYMTINGVRFGDIERVMSRVLKLEPEEWLLEDLRHLERFMVTDFIGAQRVADHFGNVGAGRVTGKDFLVRTSLPITISRGRRRTVKIVVYRAWKGCTAAWKIEVSLTGRARDSKQFSLEDAAVLQDVLQDIVDATGIEILGKPARWEPCSEEDRATRRDGIARNFPKAVYQGLKVTPEETIALSAYNLGELAFEDLPSSDGAGSLNSQSLSSDQPPLLPCPMPLTLGLGERERKIYEDVMGEIMSPGAARLSEVVLPTEIDAGGVIQAFIEDAGVQVGVGIVGAGDGRGAVLDAPRTLARLQGNAPYSEAKVRIIYIDPSVRYCTVDSVYSYQWATDTMRWVYDTNGDCVDAEFDTVEGTWVTGPLGWSANVSEGQPIDHESHHVRAVGVLLDDFVHALRDHCEATGDRIILVTTDCRSDSALGDAPARSHHFKGDARVRSMLGIAGTYWAHLRFFCEKGRDGRPYRVWLAKDEAAGQVGRVPLPRPANETIDDACGDCLDDSEPEFTEVQLEEFERYADAEASKPPSDDDPFFEVA